MRPCPRRDRTGFFISFGATYSTDRADAQGDPSLHIDIPVKLEKANVVFDIGHLVLNGDMPFFLGDMDLLVTDLKDWNVKGEIIAVFHSLPITPIVMFKPGTQFKPGIPTQSSSPG